MQLLSPVGRGLVCRRQDPQPAPMGPFPMIQAVSSLPESTGRDLCFRLFFQTAQFETPGILCICGGALCAPSPKQSGEPAISLRVFSRRRDHFAWEPWPYGPGKTSPRHTQGKNVLCWFLYLLSGQPGKKNRPSHHWLPQPFPTDKPERKFFHRRIWFESRHRARRLHALVESGNAPQELLFSG